MSYDNPRIGLADSLVDIVTKMAEGNPGAATVMMKIMKDGKQIDPDDFLAPLGAIMQLDTDGIYGSEIWQLYKDVCDQDLTKMIGMLRAVQLGLLSTSALKEAIRGPGKIDVDDFVAQVRAELPAFGQV